MPMGSATRLLLRAAYIALVLALLVAFHQGVCAAAGKPVSLWQSLVLIPIVTLGSFAMRWMEARGWLKPAFSKGSAIEERERELALERERIIEEARARLKTQPGPGTAPSGAR